MPSSPRSHRRAACWLLLAWWLVALAPGVSRAAAFVQGQIAPWSVVCSAMGQADAGGMGDLATTLKQLTEHCPACTLQADGAALPPSDAPAWLPPELGTALPRLFLQAPRPLHAWASAQPRAPPLGC